MLDLRPGWRVQVAVAVAAAGEAAVAVEENSRANRAKMETEVRRSGAYAQSLDSLVCIYIDYTSLFDQFDDFFALFVGRCFDLGNVDAFFSCQSGATSSL